MKYINIVSRNIANQNCEKYTCHASHLVGHHVEQHVSQEQFLASQDALEVMLVSELLTLRTELTDVTLVSENNY